MATYRTKVINAPNETVESIRLRFAEHCKGFDVASVSEDDGGDFIVEYDPELTRGRMGRLPLESIIDFKDLR